MHFLIHIILFNLIDCTSITDNDGNDNYTEYTEYTENVDEGDRVTLKCSSSNTECVLWLVTNTSRNTYTSSVYYNCSESTRHNKVVDSRIKIDPISKTIIIDSVEVRDMGVWICLTHEYIKSLLIIHNVTTHLIIHNKTTTKELTSNSYIIDSITSIGYNENYTLQKPYVTMSICISFIIVIILLLNICSFKYKKNLSSYYDNKGFNEYEEPIENNNLKYEILHKDNGYEIPIDQNIYEKLQNDYEISIDQRNVL